MYVINEQQKQVILNALGELPAKVGFNAMSIIVNMTPIKVKEEAKRSEPIETLATAEPGNGHSPKKA